MEHLYDAEWDVSNETADALLKLGAINNSSQFIEKLGDPSSFVRKGAINILGKLKVKEVIPQLIPLLKDSNDEVRKAAVNTLAKLGAVEVIPQLFEMLLEQNELIQYAASAALKKLLPKNTMPLLITWLGDSENPLRAWAVDTLADLEVIEAIPHFIKLLDTNDIFCVLGLLKL